MKKVFFLLLLAAGFAINGWAATSTDHHCPAGQIWDEDAGGCTVANAAETDTSDTSENSGMGNNGNVGASSNAPDSAGTAGNTGTTTNTSGSSSF